MPATAIEQMILELINRARFDPAAEAARDGIDLNEGLAAGTISTASKQPLAMNEALLSAARGHSQDMLAQGYFAHNSPQGSTPGTREAAAGYSASSWGENIAWTGTTGTLTTQMSIGLEQLLFVDSAVDSRGHRTNLMNAAWKEVGVGQQSGPFSGYNATMLTQDFGIPSAGGQFLTGVSYADTDGDAFYSIGEGRNGISIAVAGGGTTATSAAGGYSLQVAAGPQIVTFSGGGLAAPISVQVTVTAGTNAKVDVVDQGTVYTSASLTDLGGATRIVGLGLNGLTLVGDASDDTFVGTKGNDTIQGGAGTDTAIYSAARAAYTITDLGGGTVQVAGPDGTDTLSSIERLVFSDTTVTTAQPVATAPHLVPTDGRHDFNGDGTSDVLLQNNSTVVDWIVKGGKYQSGTLLANSSGFAVVGSGDFNGDGTSDILLQNGGTVVNWLLQGGKYISGSVVGNAAGYSVVGIGDFNADGTSDVLLQSGSSVVDWTLKNGAYQSGNVLANSSGYQVVGTGDFNGDGTTDVLLQSGNSVVEWTLKNGTYQSGNVLANASGYQVVGTGDFNGDGTTDVLLQNGSSVIDWILGNGAYQTGNIIANSSGYNVVGTGDYNGDGTTDILLQNGSSVVQWTMQNGAYQSGAVLANSSGFAVKV